MSNFGPDMDDRKSLRHMPLESRKHQQKRDIGQSSKRKVLMNLCEHNNRTLQLLHNPWQTLGFQKELPRTARETDMLLLVCLPSCDRLMREMLVLSGF